MQADMETQLAALVGMEDAAPVREAALLAGVDTKDVKKALEFVTRNEETNKLLEYSFEVAGETSAAKRARIVRRRGAEADAAVAGGQRAPVFGFDPDESVKLTLGERIKQQIPQGFVQLQGEAAVSIEICRSIPKGFPKYKALLAELGYIRVEVKPDADNYLKLVVDSVRSILFRDDSQIVYAGVWKCYSLRPRTVLKVQGRRHSMVR